MKDIVFTRRELDLLTDGIVGIQEKIVKGQFPADDKGELLEEISELFLKLQNAKRR